MVRYGKLSVISPTRTEFGHSINYNIAFSTHIAADITGVSVIELKTSYIFAFTKLQLGKKRLTPLIVSCNVYHL